MTLINFYVDKEEDDKLNDLSEKWNLSKVDTLKKMIREFKDKNEKFR